MKYEYKTITPKLKGWVTKKVDSSALETELNELGAQGWELVSVVPVTANTGTSFGGTTASFTYFLKRIINQ